MKAHWPISILSTLSSLVGMALPLILVRTLDPSTLGIFKIFFLYLMVLPPVTFIAGISSGLSYWAGRGEEGKKAIRISGILFLIISTIIFALLLLFQKPVENALHVSGDWLHLFAVSLFLAIASLFYDDAAIATGRIWTGAFFNSGFELLRTGVIVVVALTTHDLFMIIKAHIAVQVLKVMSGYLLAYRQDLLRWEWDPAIFKSVMRYAFPVSLAFMFGLWLNYSDQIILSKTISAAEFALYSVCCLTVPPLLILEASVTRVLIPQLSKAFSDKKPTEAAFLYRRAVNDLAFLVLPAVTGMIIFAAPIIELLFTKTYLGGTHYLRLYALWYLTLMIPQDSIARAQGQAKWILGNFICFSIITLALCFSFGSGFGATGVLTGLLVARFSSRLYTIYFIKRTLSWSLNEFIPFSSMTKMLLSCATLGTICVFLNPLFQSPLSWLLVCGIGFMIFYLLFNFRLLSDRTINTQKVLMLTPGLFIGGLEKMILNLSKGLKKSAHWQPQVFAYDFAPTAGLGGDLIASFKTSEIPVLTYPKPPRFSLRTVALIARHTTRNGVTVIHTHDLGALIYGALAKFFLGKSVRLIHTQHSFVHLNRSWKYKYYERFFTHFADSIAVVSKDTRRSYLELGIPEQKLHLIPNGVDFPSEPDTNRLFRIKKRESLIASTEALLPLTPFINDFWILYLSRIHEGKGQDHALKIWAALQPSFRARSTLVFVGPEAQVGDLNKLRALIALAPDSERIILTGASQTPQEWLRASDLFLSCSEFEGMPLAPVEAVGSGLPVVLSKIPGHEFLASYAELYLLTSPESGATIIERIFTATLQNDVNYRKALWIQSEPIRTSFTLSQMSDEYEKLYEMPS